MGLFNSMSGLNSYGRPLGSDMMMTPSMAPMSFGIVPPPAPAAPTAKKGGGPSDGMMSSITKLFGGGKGAGGAGSMQASGDPSMLPADFGFGGEAGAAGAGGAGGTIAGMDPAMLMMMLGI